MKNRIDLIGFIFIALLIPAFSGCILLAVPGALIGHTIQKSNQECDNIIVDMGYKYKQYYNDMVKTNEQNASLGKSKEKILQFIDWVDTQVKSDVERKAVARYKRMH